MTNTSGLPATSVSGTGLAFPFAFTGGSFPGTVGDCGVTIAPSASCNGEIEFIPINPGFYTDTLEMPYNNGAELQTATRDIQGTAVTPANLVISEAPLYNYGVTAVGSTLSRIFTVTNTGGSTAAPIADAGGLALPFRYLGGPYPGTGGDCNVSLAPGATCQIVVEFAPTVANIYNDTIDLSYNDGLSLQNITRDVLGTGAIPANITITEADPCDFGTIPTGGSLIHMFTLTNTGGFTDNRQRQ